MKITVNRLKVLVKDNAKPILYVELPKDAVEEMESVQKYIDDGKPMTMEFHRQKRSNDANSYCWVLCQKIAEKTQLEKEDVYRQAIKAIGAFTPMPIKTIAVERFKEIWAQHGIGWVCDELGKSKLPGYTTIAAYHGSSTYDTKEMARLIDYLVDEAKGLKIPLRPASDINNMIKEWEYAREQRAS